MIKVRWTSHRRVEASDIRCVLCDAESEGLVETWVIQFYSLNIHFLGVRFSSISGKKKFSENEMKIRRRT